MKHFIAVESATSTRGRYSFKIYQIKRNQMIFLGTGSIQYASTRGAESEVMSELARRGAIPKKYEFGYYWCGSYYPKGLHNPPQNISFDIKYIVPDNQK